MRTGRARPSGDRGFARCGRCGLSLLGSALETLREVVALPDALGSHPCQWGHHEMRHLPDGVFHCAAWHSDVLPFEVDRRCGHRVPCLLAGVSDTPQNQSVAGERVAATLHPKEYWADC